jgi:hypothetical protein
MKLRHVFVLPDLSQAQRAVGYLQSRGVSDTHISLIAGSDAVLEQIPEDLKDDSATDFVPAAMRGALGGGSIGLLAGLAAAAIPPLGVTVAGAAMITVLGAAVGTWSAALMGAGISNEVHRKFEEHIRAEQVLLVLDADGIDLAQLEPGLLALGAAKVDYEVPAALT